MKPVNIRYKSDKLEIEHCRFCEPNLRNGKSEWGCCHNIYIEKKLGDEPCTILDYISYCLPDNNLIYPVERR